MKILILALSGIGDALMFTPALSELKRTLPESIIDVLVMFKGVKDLYERLPEIDNVYYHDFMNASPFSVLSNVLKYRDKYDLSVNVYPSNRKEYNIINFLIGAKKRAGVKYLRSGFKNLYMLNNTIIVEDDTLHNVETNIKLCEKAIGKSLNKKVKMNFPLHLEDLKFADEYSTKMGLSSNDFIIGFHAGCNTLKNHINRRWAPDNFVELGKLLIKEKEAKILLFGGPEEQELKNYIVKKINSPKAINVQSNNLAQSAAMIKKCNLFITNDSGLMHIASALNIKVAALIGPTNTNYIKPWQTSHKIISLNLECSPCFFYSPKHLECHREDVKFKCIRELSVAKVYNAVEKLITN